MSQTELIAYIVIAFLVIFPLLWWLVTRFLKKSAGMDQAIDTASLAFSSAISGVETLRAVPRTAAVTIFFIYAQSPSHCVL